MWDFISCEKNMHFFPRQQCGESNLVKIYFIKTNQGNTNERVSVNLIQLVKILFE